MKDTDKTKKKAKKPAATAPGSAPRKRAPAKASVALRTAGGIKAITAPAELHLEVGARVEILQHEHLKCSSTGFVQSINGAYNYVRPDDRPNLAVDAGADVFELYPNELKVLAVFRHDVLKPDVVVRIKSIDWGKVKPKTHGIVRGLEANRVIVQPVGARKGALISLAVESVVVELNSENLSAEELVAQKAIIAVLRILDKPVALSSLKTLLGTQSGVSDIDANLARLANAGKITLTESTAEYVKAAGEVLPQAAKSELHDAVDGLAQANQRLVKAVHRAIVAVLDSE